MSHFCVNFRARHKEAIQKNVSFNRTLVYIDEFFTSVSVLSLVTGAISPRGGSGAFARFSTRYTPLLHGEYTIYTIKGPDFGTPSSHSSRTGVFWVFWHLETSTFNTFKSFFWHVFTCVPTSVSFPPLPLFSFAKDKFRERANHARKTCRGHNTVFHST